ncbi:MAG: PD-(D/E)XK nuclease-like domain-containing protein [Phycisphaerales bacterium]|nr:PD-(D/E)XK nuclease-like domain-containing protein [Phycisphaerales bacterium]
MPNQSILNALIHEPAEAYHARSAEHVTAHRLADFRRCPLLFRKKEQGLVPDRDSAAYLVGRAAHVLILEGRQRYEAQFAVGGPVNPRTGQPFGSNTKAFADWAERIGKPVLTDDQAALIEQMAASVREHLFARELLADGAAEGVLRGEYAEHRCQSRLDWVNPKPGRGIVDLKTTDSLDSFESDIAAFGYVEQMAFYRAMFEVIVKATLPVHLLAVEKREPYRCGVWQIAPQALDEAQAENETAMRELTRCCETGIWPTRFESIRLYEAISPSSSGRASRTSSTPPPGAGSPASSQYKTSQL